MITRDELVSLFGEERTVDLDRRASQVRGLSDEDSAFLAEVGLPTYVPALFTLKPEGDPEVFTVMPVGTDEGPVDVLVLGGVPGSPEVRYLLDLDEGYVVLYSAGPGAVQAEIANGSLPDFVEFLCQYTSLRRQMSSMATDEKREKLAKNVALLERLDPLAFAEYDSWWRMIFAAMV